MEMSGFLTKALPRQCGATIIQAKRAVKTAEEISCDFTNLLSPWGGSFKIAQTRALRTCRYKEHMLTCPA